jgi:ATP-binding cassette, subfamily F, member 3
MLSVSHLSIQFSGHFLFNDISFLITKTDHVGLVGKNGAGKSTLLKILAGIQQPEKGDVSKPNDFTIGYLPQEMEHQGGKTVFEEALTAFERLQQLDKEIHRIGDEVSHYTGDTHSEHFMDLLTHLHDYQEKFGLLGGYEMESETEKVLLGLGFNRHDFHKQTDTFSGGWRMRIELAKILLQKPDVLLLDEPTNHLDIESIQWLESFLKNYNGSIVLVSHDKVFLDTITNRTIEISLGKIYDYKASYSRYLEMRAERAQQTLASYENQQKQIQDMERFVERFKAKATKAKQAQSRVKALEKIDRIEIEQEDNSALRFRFPEPPRSGKVVIEAKHLTKHYGDKLVLNNLNFEIDRGDRVAFVGKNGEGKSTLSRILAGLEPYEGSFITGHNTHLGYYAQNQADALNSDKTVFETIDDAAVGEMRTKVRALLGGFLFSGDSVDKKVKVLSGGEKARLALAKLLLEPINLLIMDEPTNHLDMRSKELLKEALMNYSGALIIVSHDRDFLQGLTSKVYEFKDQTIKSYFGDIYDYLKARQIETLDDLNIKKQEAKTNAPPAEPVKKKPEIPELTREQKKQHDNKKRKIEKDIEAREENIAKMEKRLAELESALGNPDNLSRQGELLNEYQKLELDLKKEMTAWEALQTSLEEIKKGIGY